MLYELFNTVSTFTFVLLSAISGSTTGPTYDFQIQKDVVYHQVDGVELKGDLYLPTGSPLRAAVMTVHGGSWNSLICDMEGVARHLAKQGFVVFNVRYRLAPKYIYPAALEDVAAAAAWLNQNAVRLNVDPKKIATWGYSSGAHLALYVGLNAKNNLSAIVAGGSPTDFALFDPVGIRTVTFMGGSFHDKKDLWLEASPVRRVSEDSPPVFLYHGPKDDLTPIQQMLNMRDALQAKKVPVETFEVAFWGHAGVYVFSVEAVERGTKFLFERFNLPR